MSAFFYINLFENVGEIITFQSLIIFDICMYCKHFIHWRKVTNGCGKLWMRLQLIKRGVHIFLPGMPLLRVELSSMSSILQKKKHHSFLLVWFKILFFQKLCHFYQYWNLCLMFFPTYLIAGHRRHLLAVNLCVCFHWSRSHNFGK